MGVTGLWKLIEPCGKPVPVETLEGKVLAVDISIWLHQVVKGFQDNKGSALPNAHLLGLFNRLCKLLYYRVKPVFVFDGSVPQLKRETIARRQQQRSKLNSEAERIQALLLQSLAKEKVVQQALGVNAELLLKSPTKRAFGKADNADDMFKLPELPSTSKKSKEEESTDLNDGSLTSLNSSDDFAGSSADDSSSFDESTARHSYNANLQAIDVQSQHFRNLPADVRHEILVDIKETRKQSSWGRLHELPSKGDDFSVFQMKRLLKRRAVQESLEEAQQEMGGRTLTYAELNNLFTEEGIIEETALEKGTKQICSDEHTRFLLVRDLKKKLSKTAETASPEIKQQDSGVELKDENSSDATKCSDEQKEQQEKLGKEFDTELELALAMSLEDTQVYSTTDYFYESNEQLKLNRDQRKRLQNAAVGPARSYMIEYGGMNEEEVENILEKTQADDNRMNDDIAGLEEELKMEMLKSNKINDVEKVVEVQSESEEIRLHVSDDSETDSDFEEVTDETEKMVDKNLSSKDSNALEIVVDPSQKISQEEDLFADIFIPETESEQLEVIESKKENEAKSAGDDAIIIIDSQKSIDSKNLSQTVITIFDSQDFSEQETKLKKQTFKPKTEETSLPEVSVCKQIPPPASSLSILSSLKSQLEDIKKINLDDIKVDASIIEVSDEESSENLKFMPKTPVKAEIVEVCDSDDALRDLPLSTKSPKQTTPNKNRSILKYFSPDYVVKRTPDKKDQDEDDAGVAKVKSPFFVNRTPKSNGKRSASKANSSASSTPSKKSTSKAAKSLFEEEQNAENGKTDAYSLGVAAVQTAAATSEELLNEAAQMLKEQKTEDELKNIATDLANERRNLETERNRQDRMGMSINQRMSSECQELLRLFGVPYIIAPMEAEAQCAFLDSVELTNGTITDDSDIWLFGGRTVYKNFFAQNKHVLEFRAEKIENSFNCDRKKLIQLACLVGSDYTTGINGIGAVTALEILASFSSAAGATNQLQPTQSNENMRELINAVLVTLNKFRDWWSAHKASTAPIGSSARFALFKKLKNIELQEGFPSLAVVEAYLTPTVDNNREAFSWGYPDVESIREYAKRTFGWTVNKTNEILSPVLKRLDDKKSQLTIRNYFAIKSKTTGAQIKVSKRVQKAIDCMSGKIDAEEPEKAKSKRPAKKRAVPAKKQQPAAKNSTETEKMESTEIDNQQEIHVESEEQPTTSQQIIRPSRKRAAIDLHSKKSDIIPQREKEKAKMLESKAKAAEVLKQQIQKETLAEKKRKS